MEPGRVEPAFNTSAPAINGSKRPSCRLIGIAIWKMLEINCEDFDYQRPIMQIGALCARRASGMVHRLHRRKAGKAREFSTVSLKAAKSPRRLRGEGVGGMRRAAAWSCGLAKKESPEWRGYPPAGQGHHLRESQQRGTLLCGTATTGWHCRAQDLEGLKFRVNCHKSQCAKAAERTRRLRYEARPARP